MQTLLMLLEARFRQSFTEANIDTAIPVLLSESTKNEYGDYQVNGIMSAAKILRVNPRELADKVIKNVDLKGIAAKIDVAGPGFINITLANDFLVSYLNQISLDNSFGIKLLHINMYNIVVDLSSPNLAKEMHVGHLRSTVIGDCLARVFEYIGHKVIRQNHVGDWGTQFGMLIAYMATKQIKPYLKTQSQQSITDIEKFYREAKKRFDEDKDFAKLSRQYVVLLQNMERIEKKDFSFKGADLLDEKFIEDTSIAKSVFNYWQMFNSSSLDECQKVYDLLNVRITRADVCSESFYNEKLPRILQHLEDKNLIVDSKGAKCVFFNEGELLGGEVSPFIVQKQDGGYLYSTTDLAAIDYRVHKLLADKIVYVVDARQTLHFRQLFIVAKKAGFANNDTQLVHSSFGMMLNEDGHPFKTRDGGTVKLIELIDESIRRAQNIVDKRNPSWSIADRQHLARVLALGAIKYADLSKNRSSDYVFSFDKMLSFEGNTAPYLLYAYTRVQSLLNKAKDIGIIDQNVISIINTVSEHKLSLHLAKFTDTLLAIDVECYPHYLCQYLYNLAVLFMQFYELCPILNAEVTQVQSRLALAQKTAQILYVGLGLLGIETVERM